MANSQDQEWTIGKLLNWTAEYFKSKGLDEPMLSAQLLLAKVLGCAKVDLYLRYDQAIDQGQRDEFRELVKRAIAGEPIAYLIGHKEFFSLDFLVTSAVLIPRPETELLVQWVIRTVRAEEKPRTEPLELLDLGTGSGCIAVALAKYLPIPAWIAAIDRSAEAMELARQNAQRHQVDDKIAFFAGDLFDPLESGKRFDFIVSNPPYVTEADYDNLPRQIKDYEPRDALAAGKDGLEVIRKIIADAKEYLQPEGYLVLEIGYNQSKDVSELFERQGYRQIAFELDAAGVARVAIGQNGKL